MSVDELFERLRRPFQELPNLLEDLARGLVQSVDLARAVLTLTEGGELVVERRGRDLDSGWRAGRGSPAGVGPGGQIRVAPIDQAVHAADWFELAEGPRAFGEPPRETRVRARGGALDLTLPLTYADRPLGELRLTWRSEAGRRRGPAWLQAFARQCAYLVNRYEVRDWTTRRLGGPLLLVGLSSVVRDLEHAVERAARSDLPVLLGGEFGTEKLHLAATVHCGGRRRDGPFVQINCAQPAGRVDDWFERAEGGTLFLSGIDELDHRFQKQLPLHLRSTLGQWAPPPGARDVRVVASTTSDLRRLVAEGRFSQALLAELDILSLTPPPLRARPSDVEALVTAALERRGYRAEEKLTEALVAACRAYAWPENLLELERVITRLAVMTDTRPIRREDILAHAPWIAGTHSAAPAEGERPSPDSPPDPAERWIRCAVEADRSELDKLHDALARALVYLAKHFAEPVSLGQLARHAHVSQSHLSYLFRTELDLPFKGFLGRLRIHKAREILRTEPRRPITDVSLSVGFADLSHFEKSFKRFVGRNPRDYRRQAAEALSRDEATAAS